MLNSIKRVFIPIDYKSIRVGVEISIYICDYHTERSTPTVCSSTQRKLSPLSHLLLYTSTSLSSSRQVCSPRTQYAFVCIAFVFVRMEVKSRFAPISSKYRPHYVLSMAHRNLMYVSVSIEGGFHPQFTSH